MGFRSNITNTGRGIHFNPGGDDSLSGGSLELAVADFSQAIILVNTLSPPVDSANRASLTTDVPGVYTSGIILPSFTTLDCAPASIQTTDLICVTSGGNFTGTLATLASFTSGATLFKLDGQIRANMSVSAMLIPESGIGFDISGACDDVFLNLVEGQALGDGAILINHTATSPTPIDYNFQIHEFFNTNQTLINFNPPNAADQVSLNISTCQVDSGSTTTGSMIANVVSGRLLLNAEVLEADTLSVVASGAQFSLNAQVAVGDTTIQTGGVANYISVGILAGDIVVESGAVLNVTIATFTGNITVDVGGILNCTITLHTAGTIVLNGTIHGQIGSPSGETTFYGGIRVKNQPGNAVNLTVTTVSTEYDLPLPPNPPLDGQIMQADSSLELQWQDPIGIPGGSDTEIQYNNAGVLDGIPLITTDGFNLDFGDATQARFGAGSDFTVQHNGTETQIRNNTGKFSIINSSGVDFELAGGNADQIFKLGTIDNTTALRIRNGVGTDLFIVTADGVTTLPGGSTLQMVDNVSTLWGTAALNIFHNGTDTTILNDTSGGQLKIQQAAAASLLIQNSNVTNDIINKLGTTTNTTRFSIHDSSDAEIFNVLGDGQTIIGASSGDASALLEITSTTQGFLVPRMTTIQRDAISSPATGLEIYNTTTSEPEFFNGAIWQNTGATAPGGSTSEIQYNNNGVFAGASFITTDGQDLFFADFGFANFGDDSDLTIRHNGTTSFIRNNTGDLTIESSVVDKNINIILGSITNATEFDVQDSVLTSLLNVQGDGNVGINTTASDSKLTIVEDVSGTQTAILDLQSTTSGFLPPRVTTTQRDLIPSPVAGLEAFNTTSKLPNFYNGDLWKGLAPASNEVVYVNALSDFPSPVAAIGIWEIQVTPSGIDWNGIAFGSGLFVACGATGGIMTSVDGKAPWTNRSNPGNAWTSIATDGLGTFVAVAFNGAPRASISTDGGITFVTTPITSRTYSGIAHGNGVFVAVANITGAECDTSPDGLVWTARTMPADKAWIDVATDGNGTFVAVSNNGAAESSAISIDNGVTWSSAGQDLPSITAKSIEFGDGLYVVVSDSGTNRVHTSPDGINWTPRTAATADTWKDVSFGSGVFMAVASSGTNTRAMSSNNGIDWITETTPVDNGWDAITFADNTFVAVSSDGGTSRAMTVFVPSIITLAGATTYKILDDVDIGSSQLLIVDGGTVIQGFNVSQTLLSGTTTVPLIQANNFPNIRDIIIQQNGSGELYNTVAGLFAFNVLWFGGDLRMVSGGVAIFNGGTIQLGARVVQDAAGGVTNLVFGLGFTLRDNAGTIDGLIEFETGSSTDSITFPNNGIFLTNANSIGIKINQGATINNFDFDSVDLNMTDASSVMIEVENPDDVLLGSIDNPNFTGAGTPFRCNPISSSNFASPAITPTDVAFDGDGNLIISTGGTIFRMVGITNVVDTSIVARGSNTTAITWLKGDLYSGDNILDNVGRHAGFTTSITSTTATPAANISGLTNDGINLISSDNVTGTIYIHDGIDTTLAAVLDSFVPTDVTTLQGVARDGINILAADKSDGTVHVLKGDTAETQYNFDIPGGATNVDGLVVTDTGFIFCDELASDIFLYSHPVTFDHSAATWNISDSLGIVESSDRGGSSFQDSTQRTITISTVNVFVDVADSGTDIFYGSFSAMEKCRLNNETTGEVIWTGARDKGRIVSGAITLTRAGATTDIFYEIAVCINGIPQKDSITALVLPNATQISTIQSIPITRDLVATDVVKLQLRNTTNTQDPDIFASKISIN